VLVMQLCHQLRLLSTQSNIIVSDHSFPPANFSKPILIRTWMTKKWFDCYAVLMFINTTWLDLTVLPEESYSPRVIHINSSTEITSLVLSVSSVKQCRTESHFKVPLFLRQ